VNLAAEKSQGVFLEKALLDELLQVSLEGPTIDNLVPFAVVVGEILLRADLRRIRLDWLRTFDPHLIFEGVEYFIDREP